MEKQNKPDLATLERQLHQNLIKLAELKSAATKTFGRFLQTWYQAAFVACIRAEPQIALSLSDEEIGALKREADHLVSEAEAQANASLNVAKFWWHLERAKTGHKNPGFLYSFRTDNSVRGHLTEVAPHLIEPGFLSALRVMDTLMKKFNFSVPREARNLTREEYPQQLKDILNTYSGLVDASATLEREIAAMKHVQDGDAAIRRLKDL